MATTNGGFAFTADDPRVIGEFFDHIRRLGEQYGIDVYGCHYDGVPADLLDTIEPGPKLRAV